MEHNAGGPVEVGRLYAVARALTAALTASQVATAVFEHAMADFGASAVGLWLLDGATVRFAGGAGYLDGASVESIQLVAEHPVAECAATGRPIWFGSEEERDRRWPEMVASAPRWRAAAVLPLSARSSCFGCLHVGYPSDTGGEDIGFLEVLAELVSAALDRARLHDAERSRQEFLLDASVALSEGSTYIDTLQRLAAVAVPRLADLCLVDVRTSGGPIRRVAATHANPAFEPLVTQLGERYPPAAAGDHPAAAAMSARRTVWSDSLSDAFLRATTRDDEHFRIVKALGFSSYMSVPLMVGEETLGAITLVAAGSGRHFGSADVALAEELATRAAVVVAAARQRDRDHELAHELQRLLLPEQLPETKGVEVAVRYLTAASYAEAGGDFYDVMELPSGRLGFMIGDVEGHDTLAAATMGQLRSATRALAGQIREPALLVDGLRWSWDLLGFRRTATVICGRLDPADGAVVMASAGHLPPVLVDSEGRASFVRVAPTPPLGAPSPAGRDHTMVLGAGETLFLYTDGLVEERRGTMDEWLGQLLAHLEGSAARPLQETCDRVLAEQPAVGRRDDDVAILALRRSAP